MLKGRMKSVSVIAVILFVVSSISVLAEGDNFYFNGSFEIITEKENANRAD